MWRLPGAAASCATVASGRQLRHLGIPGQQLVTMPSCDACCTQASAKPCTRTQHPYSGSHARAKKAHRQPQHTLGDKATQRAGCGVHSARLSSEGRTAGSAERRDSSGAMMCSGAHCSRGCTRRAVCSPRYAARRMSTSAALASPPPPPPSRADTPSAARSALAPLRAAAAPAPPAARTEAPLVAGSAAVGALLTADRESNSSLEGPVKPDPLLAGVAPLPDAPAVAGEASWGPSLAAAIVPVGANSTSSCELREKSAESQSPAEEGAHEEACCAAIAAYAF